MLHSLPIQGVKHSVARPVSSTCASVCLSSFAELKTLSTKRSLVDLAFLCPRERETIVFQLNYSLWCLSTHVLDCILVS